MTTFPLSGPVTLQKTIPSYLYTEYQDDDDLQAFVIAQNAATQAYVDWFNAISLPVYTGPLIAGLLLDWVGTGLYGMARPVLALRSPYAIGPYNTYTLNNIALNTRRVIVPPGFITLNDDFYKRVLTWHFYVGDGKQFSMRWFKRRIARFLLGANGTDIRGDNTSGISVVVSGNAIMISVDKLWIASQTAVQILSAAFVSGILEIPFQFKVRVQYGDYFYITDSNEIQITVKITGDFLTSSDGSQLASTGGVDYITDTGGTSSPLTFFS